MKQAFKDESLVNEWLSVRKRAAKLKEQELALRNQLCSRILENKQRGTVTTILGGYKLSAQARLNASIDEAELRIISEELTDDELRCIKWKPTLVEKYYHQLPKDSVLRTVVTLKPGQASLNLK